MRRGFDRLAQTAKDVVGVDPEQGGALLVFANRRATSVHIDAAALAKLLAGRAKEAKRVPNSRRRALRLTDRSAFFIGHVRDRCRAHRKA
jgi:hypothetical protein